MKYTKGNKELTKGIDTMNINGFANSYNNMVNSQNQISKSMARISSGFRINNASDDPAGLAISEKMRSQIRGLEQANRNAQDGVSMLNTAEAGLEVGHDILQQIGELAEKATSTTLADDDRANILTEVRDLLDELDKTAVKTEFNGHKLLDGTLNMKIAVDADGGALDVVGGSMKSADLGGTNKLNSFNVGGTNSTLDRDTALLLKTSTEEAIKGISSQRSAIGSKQNRIEHTMNYNKVASENLQSAESRIRDVDVAKEMMNVTKHQMLSQVSQAMMAQQQQNAYQVLDLLR
jgi:flagellin